MDKKIKIKLTKHGVSFERYISIWDSLNPSYTYGCDAVIGYSIFETLADLEEDDDLDGGEFDYDSESPMSEEEIIREVVTIMYGDNVTYEYECI